MDIVYFTIILLYVFALRKLFDVQENGAFGTIFIKRNTSIYETFTLNYDSLLNKVWSQIIEHLVNKINFHHYFSFQN